jgi:IS1 family transposase
VAWVLGRRDTATFQRLCDKEKHLTDGVFYTDDWSAFAQVLPPQRHVIGQAHTIDIEHDNSNTRHHSGRFTRRPQAISQKQFRVDLTLRIWHAVTTTELFSRLQKTTLYIY